MPDKLIDLHLHSHCSDGLLAPDEVVRRARERGLAAIAITDHDTFDAIDVALAAADGLEFISGIELSCSYRDFDIHMLAYFVDHRFAPLSEKVQFYQRERLKRGEMIVRRLNELGIDLRMDTVKRIARKGAVGRAHVADALVREEFVRTFDEAFSRYLGYHAPAYVAKTHFDPQEAIDLVHNAGGLAVMAHPGTVRSDSLIADLAGMGLDGIEAYHSKHTAAQVRHYKELSARLGLVHSGGSDWHGRHDPRAEIGSQKVPYEVLRTMRARLDSRSN